LEFNGLVSKHKHSYLNFRDFECRIYIAYDPVPTYIRHTICQALMVQIMLVICAATVFTVKNVL
jgi:hypothetical protein